MKQENVLIKGDFNNKFYKGVSVYGLKKLKINDAKTDKLITTDKPGNI